MKPRTVILFILLSFHGFAQDTIDLTGISIQETRLEEMHGINRQVLDSLTMEVSQSMDLSRVLSIHSPVFIKTYGQGALTSSSFRGAGASHTQVLWNGININTPTMGQMDFSLVPMSFVDNVTLLHGGNSIYSSSGGLGGAIHLDNKPNWKDSLSFRLNQDISSLKSSQTALENNLITGKFMFNTRVFHISSANIYSYKNNTIGQPPYPVEKQTNAAYRQTGLMENIHYRADQNNMISARIWAQQNFRQIPRPLTVKKMNTNQEQDNDFVRTLISWENQKNNRRWILRSGWLEQTYTYRNPVSELNLNNNTRLWTSHLAYKHYFSSSFNLEAGLDYDHHKVRSSNYDSAFYRKKAGSFARLLAEPWKRITTMLLIRAESIDNEPVQLLPSLSIKYEILQSQRLMVSGNISRNYHYPTMNDLYWHPGGNPELQAEEGQSYELGLNYKTQNQTHKVKTTLSANGFYSCISNWILWQPDPVASYWRPSNLQEVHSKGIESSIKISKSWSDKLLGLNANHTYTQTENQKPLYSGDASVGKQLVYVPLHAANTMLFFKADPWHFIFQNNYIGKRYTTADNSRFMPGFTLFDFEVGRNWQIKDFHLSTSISVDNILNTDYQSVAWHPMPGRIFNLKINGRWKK
ncbi:MAG: TonB-dependent receptor [Bacteroidales bacterium]